MVEYVLIYLCVARRQVDDLSISTVSVFSANPVFPCESLPRRVFIRGPQGKMSEVVRVGLWQKSI